MHAVDTDRVSITMEPDLLKTLAMKFLLRSSHFSGIASVYAWTLLLLEFEKTKQLFLNNCYIFTPNALTFYECNGI